MKEIKKFESYFLSRFGDYWSHDILKCCKPIRNKFSKMNKRINELEKENLELKELLSIFVKCCCVSCSGYDDNDISKTCEVITAEFEYLNEKETERLISYLKVSGEDE